MPKKKTEKLIAVAKSLVGRPYKYGAKMDEAPAVFDCSGFIKYIYGKIGVELPRSTIEQAAKGKPIKNIKNLELGDLIFFHGTAGHYNPEFPGGVGHVAMYLGNGKTIYAASKRTKTKPQIVEVGGVRIEPAAKILKRKDIVVIKRILR